MLPFERIDAWRLTHRFALAVRTETMRWPREERYGLTEEIRRASRSVPTNIAEGMGKRGSRELRRYLDISLGSLSETAYLLIFARDAGLMTPGEWADLEAQRNRAGIVLWRFYQSVARDAAT